MSTECSISNGLKKLIHGVAQGVNSARASYELWFTMVGKNKAYKEFFNEMYDHRYRDFFCATIAAHRKLMFIEIACLFEKDPRATSFCNLKKALARESRDTYATQIDDEFAPYLELIDNVAVIRNKSAAHHDIDWTENGLYEKHGIMPDDVGALLDRSSGLVKDIFSELISSESAYSVARKGRFEEATYTLLDVISRGRS